MSTFTATDKPGYDCRVSTPEEQAKNTLHWAMSRMLNPNTDCVERMNHAIRVLDYYKDKGLSDEEFEELAQSDDDPLRREAVKLILKWMAEDGTD
jgi:hypothetical protein